MTTFNNATDQVQSLFVGYFGRAGDPLGANYWLEQLSGTYTLAKEAASFATQPEATAKYNYLENPLVGDPQVFINQVYQNLFNRNADVAGLAYWTAKLTAAQGNPQAVGQFILDVISGATGADDVSIRSKVDVARDFSVKISNANVPWNATVATQSVNELHATFDAATATAAKAATTAFIDSGAYTGITYAVTAASGSIAEGATEIFTIATTGVAAGTKLAYTVTGTGNAAGSTTSGEVTLDASGKATVAVPTVQDGTAGNTGTLVLALSNGKATSPTVVVNDVSTFAITPSALSIPEGQTEIFTISTTGIAAGTKLAYTITGTGTAAGSTTSGEVVLDASGKATVSITVPVDPAVGNTGTLKMTLANGLATSPTVTVTDTSNGIYTLTAYPDTATAKTFLAPMVYTPGGTDLINSLQNEDVLTGDRSLGATSLTGTIGNPNDNGGDVIAPKITDVDTINIAFTATYAEMTLDFQDITGTSTANITRISNDIRAHFNNLKAEVTTLGIANTSEQARVSIIYLNNELNSASDAVTVNLDNARLANAVDECVSVGGALQIMATEARGSDLQNQIETYNLVTRGLASVIATFETGISSFDDLVVGERPVTINIDAGAGLAIGTMRWLGNRVETYSANPFQVTPGHLVGINGLGFLDYSQINRITVTGSADVTLANVGSWETESDSNYAVDFTLDGTTATGVITADITNAASSVDAVIRGGLGSDRFYVAGSEGFYPTVDAYAVVQCAPATVLALISGGAGAAIDTLTVQSANGALIDLRSGSTGMDVMNLVQSGGGIMPAGPGVQNWNIDLLDGGFTTVTFNNQVMDTMNNTLTNFDASTQSLSIRSTAYNSVGDPATTLTGEVDIAFTQAANVSGGTVNLELGHKNDDRAVTDAFSWRNYTSTVRLVDNGTIGTTAVASLALIVNTAGALGTGAVQLNVLDDDFQTKTTLASEVGATNTVNIGFQQVAHSSDYSGYANNGLNSTTYDGSTYAGSQNVTFGGVPATKAHNIQTGNANDRVDLSYMITNANNTPSGLATSQKLLDTVIDMNGGTSDELVLSATLADPRVVVVKDPTYDGYFKNWSDIETLTINNRNGISSAYVALDAFAQTNNAGLGTINFDDVSGSLTIGFRFTNALVVNVDAAGTGTNEQTAKTTTINSFSTADITLNVDESYGLNSPFTLGNKVVFDSTGANLGNNVVLNYTNITDNGGTFNSNTLVVTSGSLDKVNFAGDLGGAGANPLTVTTADSWTENTQTTTYDFTKVVNSGSILENIVFDATAETGSTGLSIFGSTDGDGPTTGVKNTITASAKGDTITSGGWADVIDGKAGNDSITYTGEAHAGVNGISITAGTGDDTVLITKMTAGDTATVNAGAGADLVTLGVESDTYIFANTATVPLSAFGAHSTVSQMVLNVGSDAIVNYNVSTDVFNLSRAVFGTDIGAVGALGAFHYSQVTTTSALIGNFLGTILDPAGIVVVQNGANANASIYYVDTIGAPGSIIDVIQPGVVSVDNLVQAGSATLIGTLTNVSGTFSINEFSVIA